MGECRFDHGACVVHVMRDNYGKPLFIRALCTHAAAELERRMADVLRVITRRAPTGSPPPGDESRVAEWVMANLESRLTQAEAHEAAMRARAEKIAQCEWYSQAVGDWRKPDAHSDAHDACHAALEILKAGATLSPDAGCTQADAHKTANDLIRKIAKAVLGHEDAYGLGILDGLRALADEVKALREVARALKLIAETVERNRQQGVYTDDDWLIATGRDALATLRLVLGEKET